MPTTPLMTVTGTTLVLTFPTPHTHPRRPRPPLLRRTLTRLRWVRGSKATDRPF
ncbi:hypothetical protein [Streptomyces sp. NPDC051567]|uniref:hypothetical protein n=1 Tax=Streptomyces sp. NPDC051567 TaxID=3365660 RepID=UPI0037B4CF78